MADSAPLLPRDESDIRDAVAHAAAHGEAIEIVGGGTKRGVGRPRRDALALSTLGLDKVVDYDPAELVLVAEPGARLADIEALLAGRGQMLAFEPLDFSSVVGGEPGASTLGGVVGAGFSGSRRLSAGGVRDHLLGFSAVNGRGEAFKAGGRVVKNVTGYDLPKLLAGSWGQLAVLTQLALKVLPRPEASRTAILGDLPPQAAVKAMAATMRAPADVAAAAYVDGVALLRLEGVPRSIEARLDILRRVLAPQGKLGLLDEPEAAARWSAIQAGGPSGPRAEECLWRIVTPPARGSDMLEAVSRFGGRGLLDWAGGLCWARLPAATRAADLRAAAEHLGGHAMLVHAPGPLRLAIPARHPEPPAVAALTERLKRAFDPAGIFDPLRFTTDA